MSLSAESFIAVPAFKQHEQPHTIVRKDLPPLAASSNCLPEKICWRACEQALLDGTREAYDVHSLPLRYVSHVELFVMHMIESCA